MRPAILFLAVALLAATLPVDAKDGGASPKQKSRFVRLFVHSKNKVSLVEKSLPALLDDPYISRKPASDPLDYATDMFPTW